LKVGDIYMKTPIEIERSELAKYLYKVEDDLYLHYQKAHLVGDDVMKSNIKDLQEAIIYTRETAIFPVYMKKGACKCPVCGSYFTKIEGPDYICLSCGQHF